MPHGGIQSRRKMSHHSIKTEDKVKRFNRIIGQLNGIKRMVEEDRDCSDILIQIASTRAALAKIGLMMAEDHLDHCVTPSHEKGKDHHDHKLPSLLKAMKQMLK